MSRLPSPARAAAARELDLFSDLVHRIYDAGVHPERWGETVSAIANSIGADKGLLFTPALAPHHGGLVFPFNIDEKTLQLWGTRYIEHDVWLQRMESKRLVAQGNTYSDTLLMPDAEFVESVFYREFLSGIGIRRVCGGVVFEQGPGLPMTALSVFRGDGAPPFDTQDRHWLERLIPHLSRALGLMHRLDKARVQLASSRAAFDRLAFGVALLGEDLRVLHLNRAAEAALSRGDGLKLDATRQLEGHAARERSGNVAGWLAGFREHAGADQAHFSEGFTISRGAAADGSARHYLLQCAPVTANAEWREQDEAVRFVVFITDPAALTLPPSERLVAVYGLTEAQARTAREFANGGGYKTVARQLRISEETVRSHIKEIYPKMRVNRQPDLVRLVLSLAQVAV